MEQNSFYHPTKKNIKSFAASLKAIVVKGYEELAEALSLSLVCITTRLLYMLIEHLLSNIIVTIYIPGQL